LWHVLREAWERNSSFKGLKIPGIYGRIILILIFIKWDVGLWTGSSWLSIGAGGGHLFMQQ
jgi:hypothetical protein